MARRQDQDQVPQKKPCEEKLSTVEIWDRNFAKMCLLLELSYLDVTNGAFQENLIGFELLCAVTEKKMIITGKEQAMTLLVLLYQKMQVSASEAGRIMKIFTNILEKQPVYDGLVRDLKQRREERKDEYNPDLSAFQSCMTPMAALLQDSLHTLSTECFSEGLITQDGMLLVSDSSFRHTHHYITQVLKEVGVKIQQDPGKLKVFVNKIVKPLGHAKELAKSLSAAYDDEMDVN